MGNGESRPEKRRKICNDAEPIRVDLDHQSINRTIMNIHKKPPPTTDSRAGFSTKNFYQVGDRADKGTPSFLGSPARDVVIERTDGDDREAALPKSDRRHTSYGDFDRPRIDAVPDAESSDSNINNMELSDGPMSLGTSSTTSPTHTVIAACGDEAAPQSLEMLPSISEARHTTEDVSDLNNGDNISTSTPLKQPPWCLDPRLNRQNAAIVEPVSPPLHSLTQDATVISSTASSEAPRVFPLNICRSCGKRVVGPPRAGDVPLWYVLIFRVYMPTNR